jgi:hypothetical protein
VAQPLQPLHRARRFFASLWPLGPGRTADEWALAQLLPGEQDLWRRMKGPDRRHGVQVARRVERALGNEATRAVLAAALLHDVGKTVSGLGTYGRVVATLSGAVTDELTHRRWVETRGFTRRVGLYLTYPPLGADLLAMADADPLTVAWAREHHLPPEQWTVPAEVGEALAAADDC